MIAGGSELVCGIHGHSLVLHPHTQDHLSCQFCPFDMGLPRGAPQEASKRIEWAREHGLLWGDGGRSVAFLEALRGTS